MKRIRLTAPEKKRVSVAAFVAAAILSVRFIVPLMFGRSDSDGNYFYFAAETQIAIFNDELRDFRQDCGRFPTEAEGLEALFKNPGIVDWRGPYSAEVESKLDPWKIPFRYRLKDSVPQIASTGPDKIFDTPDDIDFDSKPLAP